MGLNVTVYASECNVFDEDITHNLNDMAKRAGCYRALWRPEEITLDPNGETLPMEITDELARGLAWLVLNREEAVKYNDPGGWGKYEDLLMFVAGYLRVCLKYPYAQILISR